MDTLEVITVDASLEDAFRFLQFVRRNREVRIISTRVTLDGPAYLSEKDIVSSRKAESSDGCTFLLWNISIPNPLCWSLYLTNYDSDWMPVDPRYGDPMKYPRTEDDLLAVHSSFRQQPITTQTFRYGKVSRLLSPVIEVSIPSDRKKGFFDITANFSNVVNGVWLVWNAFEERWEHETRDIECLIQRKFEQPSEFIEWQEGIFSWIRENWSDWIIPRFTYRLGSEDPEESLTRLVQSLANLYGDSVAGIDPQPPVVSPKTD